MITCAIFLHYQFIDLMIHACSQAKVDAIKDNDGSAERTRGLEATIRHLKEALVAAQADAKACAHIAHVNEERARAAEGEVNTAKTQAREAGRLAKDAIDAAERQRQLIDEERQSFVKKEDGLRATLARMKEAWTKREAEWQVRIIRRHG